MRKFTLVLMMFILILSSFPTEAADIYVVAIFDLKAEEGVSSQTALLLSNLLRKDLAASHKMTVMDRNDMDAILQAQGENLRDCTEEGCAVRLGKILDTDKIIVGNISMLGSRYMLYAKMVDIESGVMMFAKNVQASRDEGELVGYIAELADKISGEITLTGKVLQVSPTEVLVDLGKDVGISNGAALIVDRKGEAILDPQTGEVKGCHWDEIARLRVIGSAGESISRCQVISATAEALPGDRVREYEFGGIIEDKRDKEILTRDELDSLIATALQKEKTIKKSKQGRIFIGPSYLDDELTYTFGLGYMFSDYLMMKAELTALRGIFLLTPRFYLKGDLDFFIQFSGGLTEDSSYMIPGLGYYFLKNNTPSVDLSMGYNLWRNSGFTYTINLILSF